MKLLIHWCLKSSWKKPKNTHVSLAICEVGLIIVTVFHWKEKGTKKKPIAAQICNIPRKVRYKSFLVILTINHKH